MRTVFFVLFLICMGASSQAQEKKAAIKVQTLKMPVVLTLATPEIQVPMTQTAASFYKIKNARVKQALMFKTRYKRTQVA